MVKLGAKNLGKTICFEFAFKNVQVGVV